MSVTIKDIARISGYGLSTVSRAINNRGYVSDEVRQKILKVVKEQQYVPNNSARSLKLSSTKNIALLVKGITNPFFNKMISVIEQKSALRGYPLFIQNVDTNANELDIAIREAQDRNLCGVIIMGGSFGYTQERFERLGIPCVLVTVSASSEVPTELYSSIKIDDEKEGFRATEYLISLGHKRIGYIYESYNNLLTPNHLRYLGYKRALEEYNIPFDPNLVALCVDTQASSGLAVGFSAMQQLYAQCSDVTAVFAFADILAIGAAKASFMLGKRIPEDISIVGFDGIEIAEFFHPSLDTIYQPASEMALSSMEILLDMMKGGASQHRIFDAELMKRGSCKKI